MRGFEIINQNSSQLVYLEKENEEMMRMSMDAYVAWLQWLNENDYDIIEVRQMSARDKADIWEEYMEGLDR